MTETGSRSTSRFANRALLKFWTADGVSFGGAMVTTVVLPILV